MNLVAHLYLSFKNNDIIIGNWLGEQVKGNNYEEYPEIISKGILLHRKIDSFTDSHPIIKEASALFHSTQHKFSPIIIDVLFDYFLIKHWNKFSAINFKTFTQNHYRLLEDRMDEFPAPLQEFTTAMIKYNWFKKYTTISGVAEIFSQMSSRIKYPNNLNKVTNKINENKEILDIYFLDFFPELMDYCSAFFIENNLAYSSYKK